MKKLIPVLLIGTVLLLNVGTVAFAQSNNNGQNNNVEHNNGHHVKHTTHNKKINPHDYVQIQNTEYHTGGFANYYLVNFSINQASLSYDNIAKIEVSLLGKNNNVLATDTVTNEFRRIENWKYAAQHNGTGIIGAVFYKSDISGPGDAFWDNMSAYDFTKPSKEVVTVTDKMGHIFKVESKKVPVLVQDPAPTLTPQPTPVPSP